jgi:recombination protein RecT
MGNLTQTVNACQSEFDTIAQNHDAVTFRKESNFALQVLKENSYLQSIASKNPDSLKSAILNVAATGITLNPAARLAYLVPRGGKVPRVCLDISYMGLVHLALNTGSIQWVQSELVHANDQFEFMGIGVKPIHKMNPFSDRGEIIGVYCTAMTASGDYLTTTMSKAEVDSIMNKSEAKNGPWKSFYGEMAKRQSSNEPTSYGPSLTVWTPPSTQLMTVKESTLKSHPDRWKMSRPKLS